MWFGQLHQLNYRITTPFSSPRGSKLKPDGEADPRMDLRVQDSVRFQLLCFSFVSACLHLS